MFWAETGEVAQLLRCLLPRHEDLISGPQHLYKESDAAAASACHPGSGEMETEGSWSLLGSQPSQIDEL